MAEAWRPEWVGKWVGGRVRRSADGRTVWVLERMFGGKRYAIPLEASTEEEARAEFALWSRNPQGYRTKRQAAKAGDHAPVMIDAETTAEFLAHLTANGCSEKYVKDARRYLAAWADGLGHRDLRQVSLRELRQLLATLGTAKKTRIIILKSFCSWLREEARLTAGQDPTLDLRVPVSTPEKVVREKGYPMELAQALYAHCYRQDIRDVFMLRAKTGMHHSEIDRLARGDGELRRVDEGEIVGVARFIHKHRDVHTVSLDVQAFAAAERLRAAGMVKGEDGKPIGAPSEHIVDQVFERTARRAFPDNPPHFVPGELRHSFITWARQAGRLVKPKESGLSLAEIIGVTGHQGIDTPKRHYDGTQVPPMIALPLKLQHPDDPPLEAGAVRGSRRRPKPASETAASAS